MSESRAGNTRSPSSAVLVVELSCTRQYIQLQADLTPGGAVPSLREDLAISQSLGKQLAGSEKLKTHTTFLVAPKILSPPKPDVFEAFRSDAVQTLEGFGGFYGPQNVMRVSPAIEISHALGCFQHARFSNSPASQHAYASGNRPKPQQSRQKRRTNNASVLLLSSAFLFLCSRERGTWVARLLIPDRLIWLRFSEFDFLVNLHQVLSRFVVFAIVRALQFQRARVSTLSH